MRVDSRRLTFSYQGRDKKHRRTIIEFDHDLSRWDQTPLCSRSGSKPHEPVSLTLRITPQIGANAKVPAVRFDTALEACQ